MEKTTNTIESSVLYRKIDELGLKSLERAEAIAALETANRFADAISWLLKRLERIGISLTSNANLRHQ